MQQSVPMTGAKGYLVWLAANQPDLYHYVRAQLLRQLPPNALAGFGAITDEPALSNFELDTTLVSDPVIQAAPESASGSWADALKGILSSVSLGYATVQQAKTQRDLNQIQLDRIRAGLPPVAVDTASLGLQTASVGVGLTPATRNLVMWGGLALLGVLLLRGRSHA